MKNKDVIQAACPHISGMRVEDLVGFLKMFKLEAYLPGTTRNGKEPTLDRDWLIVVRTHMSTNLNYDIDLHEPEAERVHRSPEEGPDLEER